MLARMEGLNGLRREEARAGGHPVLPIEIGVGINTGRCVVGNMGSDLRFDYSVLGDPVNLASRLEGQSKTYGVRIILGATTTAAVADRFAILELDRIQVKGKSEAETVSTLLGDSAMREAPAFRALAEAHGAMLADYRARDWSAARSRLDACRILGADFQLAEFYELYAGRIDSFAATPPPDSWDGIHVAEAK
jgi:adenylate cyclase